MLSLIAFGAILVLLLVLMSNKMSPLVALIVVPVTASLVAGFGLSTSKFMLEGIRSIAPVVGMFVFAILYFGVVTDAGMVDPIIDRILRVVGTRPPRIVMASALLALLVHMDGSSAVAFLITIPAMLPIYDRLGMDKRILACAVAMSCGVNFMPWTGPTIRASSALRIPVSQIFRPLILVEVVGLVFVFTVCYFLGKKEEKRLGLRGTNELELPQRKLTEEQKALRRPHLFWVNVALTILVMTVIVSGIVDPVIMFMLGTVLALMINYPSVKEQKLRVDAHAKAALMLASILLAAGVFLGIMTGTKMLTAMAKTTVSIIPSHLARHIPFALGAVSMPLSLLFDPDSFYFGVMPVIAEVYQTLGGPSIQIAQASLLGVMTVGHAVSPLTPVTILLVGLVGIGLGEHQKYTIPYLLATSLVMTFAAAIIGVFPF